MKVSLIVAMSTNRAIGLDGKMPWHMPADLKYFKKVTMGSPILMGRKTFEAIGRPLPGRQNIVISRNQLFQHEGIDVCSDLMSAISKSHGHDEVFVIGGGALYESFIESADNLYVTLIHAEIDGDTFFPEINLDDWGLLERLDCQRDAANPYDYSFLRYSRK